MDSELEFFVLVLDLLIFEKDLICNSCDLSEFFFFLLFIEDNLFIE